ncbi:MAG: hypothetical protein K6F95_09295 [Selenomonas sp.]|uniref:hypothetical protein n=1 Tax=Selenomonas sp. TaxID=2053611 RepID=UPI0025DF4CEA|nr:hypothetical protein [Selenomonas sp.]MCR5758087.1 hypothetical protein [Selenomonas sp.]
MKRSSIIISAVVLYIVIMAVGAAAYFYVTEQQKIQQEQQQALQKQQEKTPEELQREEAKAKEEEIRRQEEAREKAAQEARDKQKRELKENMMEETISGITYYKYDWPKKPEPGVYLRPFVVGGSTRPRLAYEVYYYYHINDPEQTAWINGDHLDITAGGQVTTVNFDATKLSKHMASDAEWLVETYSLTASPEVLAAFKRLVSTGGGHILYYHTGGKSRYHDLSATEVKRIREMVELYEMLAQE